MFSALKMRFSSYDRSIREYEIVPGRGIQVLGVAPETAGQVSGTPSSGGPGPGTGVVGRQA